MTGPLDFSLEEGECLALAGASGAGKTMSALSPFGLTAGEVSGSAKLEGTELAGQPGSEVQAITARNAGFVFQQPLAALTPHLRVVSHLRECWMQAGAARPEQMELVELLGRVGLQDGRRILASYPHRLSGGERQRVMIACAIAHGPRLLVADEPTSALDARLQAGIMALLDELRRETGMALLIVSHDIPAIARHADNVLILDKGKVAEQGSAGRILTHPVSSCSRELVKAVPTLGSVEPPPKVSSPALLEVSDLSVVFSSGLFGRQKKHAVENVSFAIAEGEAVALVGGSGSGKSTIGRAICGLGPVSAGKITLAARDLPRSARSHADRQAIQPVFQDPLASLDPRWRISDSIAEPLKWLRTELSEWQRAGLVKKAMQDVELDAGLADRVPGQLSGGQAQRAAIARALICEPRLIVLDEATASLDPIVARRIIMLLDNLRRERGLALLMISHNLAQASLLCSRVAVLDQARLVEVADTVDIVRQPRTSVARQLVAASA